MKVWVWNGKHALDVFIMLIIEDDLGDFHGITYGGYVADSRAVIIETGFLNKHKNWKRIA